MNIFMIKKIVILVGLMGILVACAQNKQTKEQNKQLQAAQDFQYNLNIEYADKTKSPLDSIDFVKFRSLDFYPIDIKYIVKASFVKNDFPVPFEMATSTDRKPLYQKYGTLAFTLDGKEYTLAVYQDLDSDEEYKDYLFVPFTDLTNNSETYGGGRYIDLKQPLDQEVLLDFNQAYNPYCAYSHRWSCVIPPKENDLQVAIKAGVKKFY
jgi:uncharacterized protein (DUF1684 family)